MGTLHRLYLTVVLFQTPDNINAQRRSLNEDKGKAFFIVPVYVKMRFNRICDLWDFTELNVILNWNDYAGQRAFKYLLNVGHLYYTSL
jgi:hypothetical protein